jgi:hypothetical protein
MEPCEYCAMGLHKSCTETESCGCNHQYQQTESALSPTKLEDGELESHEDSEGRYTSRSSSGISNRSGKREALLKDQQSTGRKRAAKLYPIDRTAPCEWRGKANCGGGEYPILGCANGLQTDRHHGPDKSVVNNEQGNVHRICKYCHNRWHAKNDPGYDWNKTNYPAHSPRDMTENELKDAILDEMRYLTSKQARVKIND